MNGICNCNYYICNCNYYCDCITSVIVLWIYYICDCNYTLCDCNYYSCNCNYYICAGVTDCKCIAYICAGARTWTTWRFQPQRAEQKGGMTNCKHNGVEYPLQARTLGLPGASSHRGGQRSAPAGARAHDEHSVWAVRKVCVFVCVCVCVCVCLCVCLCVWCAGFGEGV